MTRPDDHQRFHRSNTQYARSGLADYLFATSGQPSDPDEVFPRLRWGGQFIFISKRQREAEHRLQQYRACDEFLIDTDMQVICEPRLHIRWDRFQAKYYFFVARKIALTRPGELTVRSSYDVRLVPRPWVAERYVVLKQVPGYAQTVQRLTETFPDAGPDVIEQGARKLVDKAFPMFLTREATFLKTLQRNLPDKYRDRVPTVLRLEKDERGMVQKLYLNWLRLGGEPISQLEFARQSTELLHVLHETAGLIHMDLRLDNVVVTNRGVGFVDFGSAACVGEDFTRTPMLQTLFNEMISTSQIHGALKRFRDKGKITSSLFLNCYQKIDKAVDLFYLVLQMNRPLANPDFRGIVNYEPRGAEAYHIFRLTDTVLRPEDPHNPPFRSARDVLDGIAQIEQTIRCA
ncbi:MAG: phosphotransferase [Phycisphaeraceae bacterium]